MPDAAPASRTLRGPFLGAREDAGAGWEMMWVGVPFGFPAAPTPVPVSIHPWPEPRP